MSLAAFTFKSFICAADVFRSSAWSKKKHGYLPKRAIKTFSRISRSNISPEIARSSVIMQRPLWIICIGDVGRTFCPPRMICPFVIWPAPNTSFISSVRLDPTMPPMPRISPLCSAKLTLQTPSPQRLSADKTVSPIGTRSRS